MVWTRISALCNSQQILKTPPMSYQDPVLWAWPENSTPLRSRGTNSKTVIYFLAQYPERYSKISRCGPLVSEHPKRNQNHLLTPERFDKGPPVLLVKESPMGRSVYQINIYSISQNYDALTIHLFSILEKRPRRSDPCTYLPRMQLKNLF